MNDIFLIILIIITILYIKLCLITKYETDTAKLSNTEKNILFFTNIIGYFLSVLLLSFETVYISQNYNTNIIVRSIELMIVLLLIFTAYYGHIFREKENDTWCKIASGLWPLLGVFGIISILCLNNIYTYFNSISSDSIDFNNLLISRFNKI
jgi:hypothetical protein